MTNATTPVTKELNRLSHTLAWRGGLALVVSLAAVVQPESFLIAALFAVGLIATLPGLYEMWIGFAIRRATPGWRLVLVHGVASVLFGVLTVAVLGAPLNLASALVAGWFLLYAGLAWSGALLLWLTSALRWPLVLWACVNLTLAIVVGAHPVKTISDLLFLGAVYAAIFGAWQLAVGVCVHRLLRSIVRH
jgi:uncharacterized membrane protein HdeD (DUF308 family)